MIATRLRLFLLLAPITWLVLGTSAGASDDLLLRAKDLYRTAAYDEALAMLDRMAAVPVSGDEVELSEYRVLCLIALDRKSDARSAIEAMVNANPFYQLPTDQASPRVRAAFKEVRQSLLPTIVRSAYADAKAAFDRKDPQSGAQFERVLSLLDDPDVAAIPALADLRTVAEGFRDLSKTIASRAPAAPVEALAAPPSQVIQDEGDSGVTPPTVINQTLPRWIMPGGVSPGVWQGTLAVEIDESGNVISATLRTPIHPSYDAQLLKAAKSWKYRPALKNGMPTRYLKLVTVRLGTTGTTGGSGFLGPL